MNILRAYFRNLFAIATSVSLTWRNFFHWNLSKIAIYGMALLASGLFSAIPAGIALYLTRTLVSGLDTAKLGEFTVSGEMPTELLAQLVSSWAALLTILIAGLLVVAVCIFFFAYAYFLLAKVHDSYLASEKLPIRENLYFSRSHMRRYFSITAWVSWYLLVPVLVWIAGIALGATIQIVFGIRVSDTANPTSIAVGGIYVLFTLLMALWFFRIAIRCSFAVFLLLDADVNETGKSLVLKSFERTKGKIWKLVFLAIPFLLVLWGIQEVMNSYQDSLAKNRSYAYLESARIQSGTGFTNDYEFLSNYYFDSLSDADSVDILRIQARFEEKTNTIRPEYFTAIYPYLDSGKIDPYREVSDVLFYILYFFFIEGLQAMMYLGLFRNTVSQLSTWDASGVKNV